MRKVKIITADEAAKLVKNGDTITMYTAVLRVTKTVVALNTMLMKAC